ncbi:MAG TPA: lysoplasmalogenase [Dermatophilaceae bacterium]|nr:lysoplasmalogenase [Dermatophilaceae bacterium]
MRTPSTSTTLRLGYLALAATDTWLSGATGQRGRRARRVTKPLLMPTLAASLVTDPRAAGSPLLPTTVAAQAAGWGGDVALLGEGTRSFLAGAGAIGVGHLAYVAGFLRHRDPSPGHRGLGVRAVAAAWLATAPTAALVAGRRQGGLGLPVLGYATVLWATAAAATRLGPGVGADARRLSTWGALLFVVSDAALAVGTFALDEPPPSLERAVMATYTGAQLLLSEGAARA